MGFFLKIQNYRGIRSVDFRPEGVCLLVGPNGSGKSTLLSAIEFLRNSYDRGFEMALTYSGGAWGFANMQARPETPTIFFIQKSEIQWELTPTVTSGGIVYPVREVVKFKDNIIGSSADAFRQKEITEMLNKNGKLGDAPDEHATILKKLNENVSDEICISNLRDFIKSLITYKNYFDYHLWMLRKSGSLAGSETSLQCDGQNAFSVLRNWHTSRPLRERYDFVRSVLQEAFPSFFDDLDFESAGQTVSIRIFSPNSNTPIPVYFVPNGFLTAMLHLMAVCSAPDRGILGIDEPENGLHPYAVKTILNAFRERSEEKHLTILLATHSPFLLNQFKDEPHRVFVMDQNAEDQLMPLDKLRDPEWLKYFALGDLYGSDFAIQEKHVISGGK